MKHLDFNHAWLFEYAKDEEWLRRAAKGRGQTVNLPHDFRISLPTDPASPGGANEAYFPGGYGYYEKRFQADEALLSGPCYLYFDGVYRMSELRLNNQLLCLHQGGYSPFYVRIDQGLRRGENTLCLRVNANLLPGSRWYPGAGIYRGVELLSAASPAHLLPDGLWLDTLALEGAGARLQACARVSKACPRVRFTLLEGQTPLAQAEADAADGLATAALCLERCRPWSAEDPYLYTLRAEALDGQGRCLDEERVQAGVRTVTVNAEQGLLVNGKAVKLKGGCVHHDNGLLGAASHRGSEYRKARLLKQNGFNAVRCAHNPPSASFLNACDVLGLYVVDEAFDAWREGKRALDEHIYFLDCWQEEMTAMVRRDRRHPSVVLWSTGNEVQERSGMSDGAAWSRRLASFLRELDPSRPITNALCGFFEETELQEMELNGLSTLSEGKDYWAQRSEGFAAPLDVVGYNYLLDRYEKDHALFPRRVLLGTESFPLEGLANWRAVERLPYLIGDFVWTALDYLGEAGIGRSSFSGPLSGLPAHPWRVANCGDLDITGRKRPQSHLRDFYWTDRTTPYLCVQHPRHFGREESLSNWGWPQLLESWTFPGHEGQNVAVTVYGRGASLRLLLNGQAVACQPLRDFTARFTLPYAPGLLEAVALDERGGEIGRCALETAGAPAQLRLAAEKENMPGTKLRYVWIELTDGRGVLCPNAQDQLRLETLGCRLLALGNADPCFSGSYASSVCPLYQGRALAILRVESAYPCVRALVQGLPEQSLRL